MWPRRKAGHPISHCWRKATVKDASWGRMEPSVGAMKVGSVGCAIHWVNPKRMQSNRLTGVIARSEA
jgi:hypothetical protein